MQSLRFFVIAYLFCITVVFGQTESRLQELTTTNQLFEQQEILPLRLSYSNKQLKKETNDSTYINSVMSYMIDNTWNEIDIDIRARGNNRLKNCYFVPLKLSLKKKITKGTIFEGNKKLKMVLPCLQEKDKSDNVIKEYVAYKLFETVSPNYFKTRLVDIVLFEPRGKRVREHQLKGFLIEDDKTVAKRLNGKVYDRNVHALNQDDLASVRHAFFQYLIGNTDFSQVYQHNVKLMFIDQDIVPVPYDFDMAGLVNSSYAVVSQIGDNKLAMSSVTERKYRGFKRDRAIFMQVREEFLSHRSKIMACLDDCKSIFDSEKEFEVARSFVLDFFKVLTNDQKFKSEILDQARTK